MRNRIVSTDRVLVLPAVMALAIVLGAPQLGAQDWPQWRGPARDGLAAGQAAPKVWPKALKRAWKVTVGEGHASPVVAAGRVFVFTRVGEDEVVSAIDPATGKAIWEKRYKAPYAMNSAATSHGKGPKSTPLVSGGRVFTFGISGILSCLDAANGRVVWQKDFAPQFKSTSPLFGVAASPILEGGLLIVHVGGHDDGALTAFDPATGAVRWALKGDGPAYASPVVAQIAGTRQLITQTQTRVIGVDPVKGALLWSLPFTTDYDQNSITPLVSGDLVLYSGLDKALKAVRIGRKGSAWEVTPVWEAGEAVFYMSTPIAAGGRIFGLSHRKKGQITALDPKTGRILWVSEGRKGENAALIAVGPSVLALNDAGLLVVFDAAATGYAPLATYTVAESATWAHPAPVAGGLVVKDVDTLALYKFE